MHWHEDLQFILVLDGTIEVRTLDSSVLIHAGEGLFINRNVVHDVRRLGNCHYNSFLFPAYFLEFYAGSPAKDFVDSVTSNEWLVLIHFTTAIDWHRETIAHMQQLVQIEKNKTEFYVYEVLVRLSLLWLVMRKHVHSRRSRGKVLSGSVCRRSSISSKNTTRTILHWPICP